MDYNEVARIFLSHFRGEVNMVTPHIVDCRDCGNGILAEVSRGFIFDKELYGVTVLRLSSGKVTHLKDMSKPFPSLREAMDYVEKLSAPGFISS